MFEYARDNTFLHKYGCPNCGNRKSPDEVAALEKQLADAQAAGLNESVLAQTLLEKLRETQARVAALEAAGTFNGGVEAAIANVRDRWLAAYPEDIFTEPTKTQYKLCPAALKTIGLSIDQISGSFGRHISKCIIKELESLKRDAAISEKRAQG